MKGSDTVEMTINIGGELIKLEVKFDEQLEVRDAERDIKNLMEGMRKASPDSYISDKKLLAMAVYQYASWYNQLIKIQQQTIDLATEKINQSNDWESNLNSLHHEKRD